MVMLSHGNHETAILKNNETDILQRSIDLINREEDTGIKRMGYAGFVRFKFRHQSGGKIRTKNLFFHHGKFGGVVTMGALGVKRFGAIVPDADFIVTGHTHDKWNMENQQFKLKANGVVEIKTQEHIKCGTYKREFKDLSGWAIEKIVLPKSFGGWFIRFYVKGNEIKHQLIKAV